jgi:hypothetical protein
MTTDFELTAPTDETEEAFYLPAFTDGEAPCDHTREAWAEWLGTADPYAGLDDPRATDGDVFPARAFPICNVAATRTADGWEFGGPPPGFGFHALRYSKRDGWSEDMMGHDRDDIAAVLAQYGTDPIEYIACFGPERHLTVVFRAGPPPRLDDAEDAE